MRMLLNAFYVSHTEYAICGYSESTRSCIWFQLNCNYKLTSGTCVDLSHRLTCLQQSAKELSIMTSKDR